MEQKHDTSSASRNDVTTHELVRPHEGRMFAGVSVALANRFDIPVLLVRALFVILTLGGGMGIVLYFTGWFLIPSEGETESPAERFFSGLKTER